MPRIRTLTLVLCLGLVLAALAAYSNHFQNEFHFDDFHTITNNVFIGDIRNIARFFADGSLFSTQPVNASYRPVTSASLAIDYWLGGGFKPFYFHLSTFLWFDVQLVLMFFLFRRIMDVSDPHPSNQWAAFIAAAVYGLHPASAETVNYIIQRGDLYNTLGAVAGLLWFACDRSGRRRLLYMLPVVIACLAKPPALVFPLLLWAYVLLFEEDSAFARGQGARMWAATRATLPALAITAATAVFIGVMTPATYHPGATSPFLYRLTQPWIALHYFHMFFLPTALSADTDWTVVPSPFDWRVFAGAMFAAVLAAVAVVASRRPNARPIAFGIVWFFVTLIPTALMPLADVTNDHRMYFPFVGLALAVVWSVRLALFRRTNRLSTAHGLTRAVVVGAALILIAAAVGTRERNEVWRTEESLWRDVTEKSPNNGRGMLNYGSALLNRGETSSALPYLLSAERLTPANPLAHVNLGIAYGLMEQDSEAVRHFERAVAMSPNDAEVRLYYGRFLKERRRLEESRQQLETAVRVNPRSFAARYLLMQVYSALRNRPAFDALMQDTLKLAYSDEAARRYLSEHPLGAPASGTP